MPAAADREVAAVKTRFKSKPIVCFVRLISGGTSTLYVSPVPFEAIDETMVRKPGRPEMKPSVDRLFILAVAGHLGALILKPNRPMVRGIFTGAVRLDYARHRHPLWMMAVEDAGQPLAAEAIPESEAHLELSGPILERGETELETSTAPETGSEQGIDKSTDKQENS
jgi:hypothetical protein